MTGRNSLMGLLNMKANMPARALEMAAETEGACDGRWRASSESSCGGRTMNVSGRASLGEDARAAGTPIGVSADDMGGGGSRRDSRAHRHRLSSGCVCWLSLLSLAVPAELKKQPDKESEKGEVGEGANPQQQGWASTRHHALTQSTDRTAAAAQTKP